MSNQETSPVRKTENMDEYRKQYYQDHKEKLSKKSLEAGQRFRIRQIVKKLNNKEYKHIPYTAITKHRIRWNNETRLYELPE